MDEKFFSSSSTNSSINWVNIVIWTLLFLIGIGAIVLSVISLSRTGSLNSKLGTLQNIQSTACGTPGPQGAPGPQGPIGIQGPAGPAGTFNLIGSTNITGIYSAGKLHLPSNTKITVPKSQESNLVFVLNNLLTDNNGIFFAKEAKVYQFNLVLDSRMNNITCSTGMTLRVYQNDQIVSYYDILTTGSHALVVPVQCKVGDTVRFGLIANEDGPFTLLDYGCILSVLV
jgi:hypothetical protein